MVQPLGYISLHGPMPTGGSGWDVYGGSHSAEEEATKKLE